MKIDMSPDAQIDRMDDGFLQIVWDAIRSTYAHHEVPTEANGIPFDNWAEMIQSEMKFRNLNSD